MDYKSIGKNIRRRRDELGLKQEALAELVNISTSYMGAIERGEKLPKLEVFVRIANALKISSDSLLINVLDVRNDILASDLSDQLSSLPQTEKRRILSIIQTIIESYKQ